MEPLATDQRKESLLTQLLRAEEDAELELVADAMDPRWRIGDDLGAEQNAIGRGGARSEVREGALPLVEASEVLLFRRVGKGAAARAVLGNNSAYGKSSSRTGRASAAIGRLAEVDGKSWRARGVAL